MNPRHVRRHMLSGAELRILSHLSKFQGNENAKWNIPREQSLPGIAESLGVVRSALHIPLNSLEKANLVISRNAKVSGIKSRKRTVIHITEEGLSALSNNEKPKPKKYRNFGPIPNLSTLHGRDVELEKITELLEGGKNIILNGLPGIGKTSLARGIADSLMAKGWISRWASCNGDSDVSSIAEMWLGQSGWASPEAIATNVNSSRTLLVIDEIQELNKRHFTNVENLLSEISSIKSSVLIMVRAPSPFKELPNYENIRLDGLSYNDAREILPSDLDEDSALNIAQSLGGHPLALHLWSPKEKIPEKVEAVQEYVRSTVIKRLSGEGLETLDELCLSPIPLSFDELFYPSGANELDNSAILRWKSKDIETHHLIRNVRRNDISLENSHKLNSQMAKKWSTRQGYRAKRMEVHFHLNSGKDIDSGWLISNLSDIINQDSAAAAIIAEQAVEISDDTVLRETASDIALERGETDVAKSHIKLLPDGPRKKLRQARLARIKGDSRLAEKLDLEAMRELDNVEGIKYEISTLVRLYDDRLPGPIDPTLAAKINKRINSLEFSNLPSEQKNPAILSLHLLKFSIASELQNLSVAASSRSLLESQLGHNHPRLRILDLRSRLFARENNMASPESIEAARNEIEKCDNLLDKISLIHATLEASGTNYPQWLTDMHSKISEKFLREDIAAYRRISAQKWFWRGLLEPERKLSHWRESLDRFRKAECSNAANELLKRISKII